MKSEAFVRGMLDQVLLDYRELRWYQLVKKARYQGWINACKAVLGECPL